VQDPYGSFSLSAPSLSACPANRPRTQLKPTATKNVVRRSRPRPPPEALARPGGTALRACPTGAIHPSSAPRAVPPLPKVPAILRPVGNSRKMSVRFYFYCRFQALILTDEALITPVAASTSNGPATSPRTPNHHPHSPIINVLFSYACILS
jgi:hypothetical protein